MLSMEISMQFYARAVSPSFSYISLDTMKQAAGCF